jgi:hypothetical protein
LEILSDAHNLTAAATQAAKEQRAAEAERKRGERQSRRFWARKSKAVDDDEIVLEEPAVDRPGLERVSPEMDSMQQAQQPSSVREPNVAAHGSREEPENNLPATEAPDMRQQTSASPKENFRLMSWFKAKVGRRRREDKAETLPFFGGKPMEARSQQNTSDPLGGASAASPTGADPLRQDLVTATDVATCVPNGGNGGNDRAEHCHNATHQQEEQGQTQEQPRASLSASALPIRQWSTSDGSSLAPDAEGGKSTDDKNSSKRGRFLRLSLRSFLIWKFPEEEEAEKEKVKASSVSRPASSLPGVVRASTTTAAAADGPNPGPEAEDSERQDTIETSSLSSLPPRCLPLPSPLDGVLNALTISDNHRHRNSRFLEEL